LWPWWLLLAAQISDRCGVSSGNSDLKCLEVRNGRKFDIVTGSPHLRK
jgi:hypothetical protein